MDTNGHECSLRHNSAPLTAPAHTITMSSGLFTELAPELFVEAIERLVEFSRAFVRELSCHGFEADPDLAELAECRLHITG